MSKVIIISFRKNSIKIVTASLLCLILLWGVSNYVKTTQTLSLQTKGEYVILANNDLGMHCIQSDYSAFMIFPPGNNLVVQVFAKGREDAQLITSGITLEYEVNNNTSSADKVNFWKYAEDYGFNIASDEGITGNKLKGTLTLSKDKKYFEATAIPVVPYNDNQKQKNPYQTVKITVKESSTGKVIAIQDNVVLPVSDEMMCSNCHGTEDTDKNILKSHDKKEGTKLYADLIQNIRHRCSECHSDNILNAPEKGNMATFHRFHWPCMVFTQKRWVCQSLKISVITATLEL